MIIPLNIVLSYPVHWGKYEVFRDFIQNFYDSVDVHNWISSFQYEFKDNRLDMWIRDVTFSYEWLLHIGASTKTAASSENAGYFGEGFKIASLCALRDYDWDINMASGSWSLSVIRIDQKIDNTRVQMLAYDVNTNIENQEETAKTRLTLYPLTESDYTLFLTTINSFYFPENPLIGEKLWEGKEGAVYLRGHGEYDENLPYTRDFGRKGAVFCAYQLLGSNPFGLTVCLHHYRNDDRERRGLYTFQVRDVFQSISRYIDAYGAMRMLEKMRRYWNSVPTRRIDIHSWYPVICNLIDKMQKSQEVVSSFVGKYPNLLCLRPIRTMRERNRRGQARAWLARQETKYLLVQSHFTILGYTTLEELCEKNQGFAIDDTPSEIENQCFSILEKIVMEIYKDLFDFDGQTPQRRIIRNETASYHGMAKVFKRSKPQTNAFGLTIRYRIEEVYLKESIFTMLGFHDAISTYIHECCHMFGGDSSNSFSLSLTYAMEIMLKNAYVINECELEWLSVFRSLSGK